MSITIVIILFVLLLMTSVLFYLLQFEIRDINNKSKIYFTRKAQEYTDSINRSEQPVDAVPVVYADDKDKKDIEEKQASVIYVDRKANYEINDLLKMMKQIDEKFDVNNVKVIQNFIATYVKKDDEKIRHYNDLIQMKKVIDKVGVFTIITSDNYDFDSLIKKLRLINEDIFMEYYSDKDEFDVNGFCDFLDYEIGKCDPTIYIYVGNHKLNYDKIDKRIKTVYSDDIYKGVKIIYLNKLYDYSLS